MTIPDVPEFRYVRQEGLAIVASGGFCAPIPPLYSPWCEPWETRDYPSIPGAWTWNRLVAPRLTHRLRQWAEARRRVSAAWVLIRHGDTTEHNDEDEWW